MVSEIVILLAFVLFVVVLGVFVKIMNRWKLFHSFNEMVKMFNNKLQTDFVKLGNEFYIVELMSYFMEARDFILKAVEKEKDNIISLLFTNDELIKNEVSRFSSIDSELNKYVCTPDKFLKRKFYDPFTGELLLPVHSLLKINHSKFGFIEIKVNEETFNKYNDPNLSSLNLNFNDFYNRPKQSYLLFGNNISHLSDGQNVEFQIFDSVQFFNTFCNNVDEKVENKND
jgi:hypothetical protein